MTDSKDKYMLSVNAYNLKSDIKREPEDISYYKIYGNLKDAFDALHKYDSRAFDRNLAIDAELDIFIESAGIFKNDTSILLIKRKVVGNAAFKIVDGIYIEFNSKSMSPEDFAKLTEHTLPPIAKKGLILEYMLVESIADLKKTKPKSRKVRKGRNGHEDPGNNKGLTPK